MAPKRRKPSRTIERKIHFYRVDAGVTVGGQPIVYDARQKIMADWALKAWPI